MTVPLLLACKRPIINWSFTPGALPSGVTLTRASSKLSFNASGILEEIASGVPAFEYDPVTGALLGLWIEPQATNLGPYSVVTIKNYMGMDSIITNSSGRAPDGTNTLALAREGTSNDPHFIYELFSTSFTGGTLYTASIHAKAGTADHIQVTFPAAAFGSSQYGNFYLGGAGSVTASAGCTASIKNMGGGIYRCSITETCATTAAGPPIAVGFINNPSASRLPPFTGTSRTVYLWGAQTEIGSIATSYIPTNGSAVTRAADQLSFTIPSGVSTLRYVFDNNSTQDVAVSAGAYIVPTTLNRTHIKRIQGFAK